ncbi:MULTISPECIES: 5-carboxymethyl-2-hydroxymuconate Delta-isomerase [Vibrio]|uniref:5-carboxymethyl-2-hydroxymuconate isomerase n=2 Tax=Vibrio coralliilyticus TaxID=190893 RepID=A0AAN0SKQ1_9VIBR|nr:MULTISPECIES: 5-carboxymethyl-2-hydroxymuconate Delta-isomerase [Vibrio]AIW22815.1 5-carboxymethyl-2-hydroxymuconate isomerase [Vibrio coralliilyticus]EEX34375.1 tautomerase [Vibrio coralliilyticus ATCC BAA-450]MDE3898418.1 5-carboxymethyl-2-hydroxymuconate Delta-isomerase [Vibrio sp. CC007]NOH38151.1 5-carboxymethyl-2-hydroxymuconate Delta-isomerase [Vibrio coralliilyticus]NOH55136.1 5-carboxymethyl-2-hydroxymuconate Delta-isomerase [Vibrio coralliilyticus]
MPHFVLDCSDSILAVHDEAYILEQMFLVTHATGLFDANDIKIRINPFQQYSVGNKREAFIHVFASIMQGRTTEEKARLSQQVVSTLVTLFPKVPNIAMNISDFEQATYCNRTML